MSFNLWFCKLLLTVTLFLGYCQQSHAHVFEYKSASGNLSLKDSLIQEMVDFIQPDFKLDKLSRLHIENRINKFPHKILRRDTISHFINYSYAVAYYEFVTQDYKRAKKWVEEFQKATETSNSFSGLYRFSAVGFYATISINLKGNLKNDKKNKIRNSWSANVSANTSNTLFTNFKRDYVKFIGSFIADVSMNCDYSTYHKLLSAYKQGGGEPGGLNTYLQKGLYDKCIEAGREDVFKIIFTMWNVSKTDFSYNRNGFLEFTEKNLTVDSSRVAKMNEMLLLMDLNQKRRKIDSLLAINPRQDLTTLTLRLISQYCTQSRFMELVNDCQRLQQNVNQNSLSTLHNYWALGLSNTGQYDEALTHYDIATSLSHSPANTTGIRLNKAYTLGEMGQVEEANKIFMEEKSHHYSTPFQRFVWNDNLGYIHSAHNPALALYYYNEAEKHLDSGILYDERKIRHFCRKAKLLESNKYLQREAIDKALGYVSNNHFNSPAKGMARFETGVYHQSHFDYKEAEQNFNIAYECYGNLAPLDMRLTELNRKYAENLFYLDKADEAITILNSQLELLESNCGHTHPEYAKTLLTLFKICCQHDNTTIDPDSLYRTLTTLEMTVHPQISKFEGLMAKIAYLNYKKDTKSVIDVINNTKKEDLNPFQKINLYKIYEKSCREGMDLKEYEKCMALLISDLKKDIFAGLLNLSEDEAKALQEPFDEILTGSIIKEDYGHALELSLFRKGLLLSKRSVIEKTLSSNRKTQKKFKALQMKRQELNAAIAFNDSVHIPALYKATLEMERELNFHLSKNKQIFSEVDRTLSKVISRLKDNEIAVEFVKYRDRNRTVYGSFTVNNSGSINFNHIAAEDVVIQNPSVVWEFLSENINCYSDIYFCPDGKLNNIGLEFLPVHGKRPINQIANIHRVFHLAEFETNQYIGDNIAVLGVSDHNSPIGEGESLYRGNWTDLPNVKTEIQLIKESLNNFSPCIMFNDEVTEAGFTSLSSKKITTLHISTHGFFRDHQTLMKAAKDTADFDHHIAKRFLTAGLDNISGLVLRQGNLSWKTPYILEENDDLLTVGEIETMNFPFLNLTVLSACDTGLGKIDGEGVWGLQRAFRIAGSKNLVCALSKVEDYWTTQFMDMFYQEAAKGVPIYQAFHTAQRWLYRELPDNPEVWSSFILIE